MNKTNFTVDQNKLTVTRTFDALVDLVWRTWTEAELLDQWWAPKPWSSVTKSMDFRKGGQRLYAMVGPKGEEHWGLTTYKKIEQPTSFSGEDAFCDYAGNINPDFPVAKFQNHFKASFDKTLVTIVTEYTSEQQLQQIIEMGMKEGLSMAFENLDHVLKNLIP